MLTFISFLQWLPDIYYFRGVACPIDLSGDIYIKQTLNIDCYLENLIQLVISRKVDVYQVMLYVSNNDYFR